MGQTDQEPRSDNFPKRASHLVACQPEGTGCGLSGGPGVHQRGLLSRFTVLNGDGLDASAEDCVPLFEFVECGGQLDDHGFGVVGENDQFQVDLFVSHLYPSCDSIPRFGFACAQAYGSKVGPSGGWPTQARVWLEWGSSMAGQSRPSARSRSLAVHSDSISTQP